MEAVSSSVAPGAGGAQTAVRELLQTAALLVGDREQAVAPVEETLAGMNGAPCESPASMERKAQRWVAALAGAPPFAASLKRVVPGAQ